MQREDETGHLWIFTADAAKRTADLYKKGKARVVLEW